MASYVHHPPGTEIGGTAIHYILDGEERIQLDEGEILCLRVHTVAGSACCGAGELAYLVVPGRIVSWQHSLDTRGLPVSQLEYIREPAGQESVKKFLTRRYPSLQVVFEVPR
ncbi:MAG: hypothetical protein EPN93_17620 [Spirochaetes bacterium]|nr:MAG: hypothetical protein EPN93_17620 [Spirochaetota bacterium]